MTNPYQDAGVNVESGYKISKFVKQNTHSKSIGNFGGVYEIPMGFKHPVLVSSDDGVGTKLLLTNELRKWDTIGIDCVAMCVNDILAQGAIPQYFLDYISTGKVNQKVEMILKGVIAGCKQADAALIGGETAEMPGVYGENDYDIAGFAVGICEKDELLTKKRVELGDVLIGITSSGIHSNGYSLVRKIFFQEHDFNVETRLPEFPNQKLGDILLEPTKIYTQELVPLLKQRLVKGIAHITGGGFYENVPRILPDDLGAEINVDIWPELPIFQALQKYGQLQLSDMYHIFNMGLGIVLAVDPKNEIEVLNQLNQSETLAYTIGSVVKRKTDSLILKGEKL
ncbi:phosphoribosylformylglycinamidine cyclo-ligase [Companilactobacillus alimentarius]|uniref:Phosphoribosylformylglycinamidine cyclo-ligase n=1 Tax=Companilactobacillus alimentarius DSM 20249 TaxID=1423720 RepID=A0A2K9HHX8_9LACO|nr:phosphoribosylformylglycinamidine cyclo-ligase [Companilactobacillus alimentarius]AUI71386.1 phosphoribosylformylglycinamidine cyclo-ligase [Companilactobacillus alimentarius DSM 20249]KRK74714.1 phospho ribosylformylglycinamidine cyclo-ligase [Companilactobacillus alimentarius DSM 20249]GEO44374.1 phosphoribosylformylglycinamidine cyclo-ligase [Companilactobacillus alimentarius]